MSSELYLPLAGKMVVITRAQEKQGEAHNLFKSKGANLLDLPALVITPPDDWGPLDKALEELDSFNWLIFSSGNGVQSVESRLKKMGKTLANKKTNLKIAAVGRKTSLSLQEIGVFPDYIPPRFVADSLIEHFPEYGLNLKMLIPRVQTGGRNVLSESFGKAGINVIEVPAYESCCPNDIPDKTVNSFLKREIDAIVFTSAKIARHTAQLISDRFGPDWREYLEGVNLISIGPQTSLSCQKYFSRVTKEASPHDLEGLINACIESFNKS